MRSNHVTPKGGRDEEGAEEVDEVLADGDEAAAVARLEVRLEALARAEHWVAGSFCTERERHDAGGLWGNDG